MSDKLNAIAPALTAEEWTKREWVFNHAHGNGDTFVTLEADGTLRIGYAHGENRDEEGWASFGDYGISVAPLIALANAALPDDDPHKFTRVHVAALRAMSGNQSQMEQPWAKPYHAIFRDLADSIETLLPPNG